MRQSFLHSTAAVVAIDPVRSKLTFTGMKIDVPDLATRKTFVRVIRDWPIEEKGFARMMLDVDLTVTAVVAKLREHGLAENTLVIFSSDNGPHQEGGHLVDFFDSNGPLKGRKHDLYEGGIRVPLIAKWPGKMPAGKVSDHLGGLSHAADQKTIADAFAAKSIGNKVICDDGGNVVKLAISRHADKSATMPPGGATAQASFFEEAWQPQPMKTP